MPTDFEEKEREEDANAAPLHLDSLRKSIVGKTRYKKMVKKGDNVTLGEAPLTSKEGALSLGGRV